MLIESEVTSEIRNGGINQLQALSVTSDAAARARASCQAGSSLGSPDTKIQVGRPEHPYRMLARLACATAQKKRIELGNWRRSTEPNIRESYTFGRRLLFGGATTIDSDRVLRYSEKPGMSR